MLDRTPDWLSERLAHAHADQPEFAQAVADLWCDVSDIAEGTERIRRARVFERLVEPDRVIRFRVVWLNDAGGTEVHRGWRVQTSNAIGPYKGGLRFHPSVSEGVLKFLGFEQVFKNALTGLMLGGAKGGSDFDPDGRSEAEVMRFCQAFMAELHHHIGPNRDVPAGDINVSSREIGYLFGAYTKLAERFEGALTGKGLAYGGSEIRSEATGWGAVMFLEAMLAEEGGEISGQRIAISGAGNVAVNAAEYAAERGARVVTLSDSSGTIDAPDGMSGEAIAWVRAQKAEGAELARFPERWGGAWREGETPWFAEADIAMPCATENEISGEDARALAEIGCRAVVEGANMPLTADAVQVCRAAGMRRAPGKAANAGGVALSGLEMQQNAEGVPRSREDLERALRRIMGAIHARCLEDAESDEGVDYARGANRWAFRRVADAVVAQGAL